MKRAPSIGKAFALIEVIVAAVILGLAVSTMLGLMARAVSAQTEGERIEAAARLADERLHLVLAVGAEKYPSVFPLSGACEAPFESYRYEVTLEAGSGGLPYRVRAVVSWTEAARTRSVTLDTLIAPRAGEEPDPDRKPKETLSRE